ncbi:hypothetical protein NDU88_000872 [Pleurodeles waltl]|uniref:Uncharacterized protein n=1 Tax=Pleurodeles waltl TaxID=8319 RepID=A0AAV7SAR0_PLEWA|nr:hypothetical protein NDU88_000872 [Pleurodeles waltl]
MGASNWTQRCGGPPVWWHVIGDREGPWHSAAVRQRAPWDMSQSLRGMSEGRSRDRVCHTKTAAAPGGPQWEEELLAWRHCIGDQTDGSPGGGGPPSGPVRARWRLTEDTAKTQERSTTGRADCLRPSPLRLRSISRPPSGNRKEYHSY